MGKGGDRGAQRTVTMAELRKHDKPGDAWIAIHGAVSCCLTNV